MLSSKGDRVRNTQQVQTAAAKACGDGQRKGPSSCVGRLRRRNEFSGTTVLATAGNFSMARMNKQSGKYSELVSQVVRSPEGLTSKEDLR
jgi:hypothetical protein